MTLQQAKQKIVDDELAMMKARENGYKTMWHKRAEIPVEEKAEKLNKARRGIMKRAAARGTILDVK